MSICDANGAELLVQYSDQPDLAYDSGSHTWVDIRDVIGKVEPSGGDKSTSEFKTFNGVKVNVSKPGAQNIMLSVAFENDANSFLNFLQDTWNEVEDKCYWIRWAYNNGATGSQRRSAKVVLLTNPYTGGAADGTVVTKDLNHVTEVIYSDVVP